MVSITASGWDDVGNQQILNTKLFLVLVYMSYVLAPPQALGILS